MTLSKHMNSPISRIHRRERFAYLFAAATIDSITTIRTVLLNAIFEATAVPAIKACAVKKSAGPMKHRNERMANKI